MSRIIIHKLSNSSIKSYGDALLALRINLRVTLDQLQELTALLRLILSDEHFVTTMEVEGFTAFPEWLGLKQTK